jgi:hypothetical protein
MLYEDKKITSMTFLGLIGYGCNVDNKNLQ